MQRLAQVLAATGRHLRNLGLKLAIKIPFFVEIEISYEADWTQRRLRRHRKVH